MIPKSAKSESICLGLNLKQLLFQHSRMLSVEIKIRESVDQEEVTCLDP